PKWAERPLLIVVLKEGQTATNEEMLAFLEGKIASWWMPDDVVFVPEIPHTATGKILKTALRERFKDYVLPTAPAAVAPAGASGSGRFCGASGDFWRLLLRGGGLLLPTLGLYRFWLATDV